MRELRQAPDRPYVFHLGAQAHVGESWHRPYETVTANVVGTLNLLQAIVDWELEIEKFDTAGTSEEYGNVHEAVTDHHDFDDAGGLILHERSPINPKSIYAALRFERNIPMLPTTIARIISVRTTWSVGK